MSEEGKSKLEYVWAPWARGRIADGLDWPRSTIIARMMEQGAGASIPGARSEGSNEEAEKIEAAILRLADPAIIRIVCLRYVGRLRDREIQRKLRRSRSYVQTRLTQAHRRLQGAF